MLFNVRLRFVVLLSGAILMSGKVIGSQRDHKHCQERPLHFVKDVLALISKTFIDKVFILYPAIENCITARLSFRMFTACNNYCKH